MGIVKEIEIWLDEQMVYAQLRIHPGERDVQSSLGFWETYILLYLGQRTRLRDSQQKKEHFE